MATKAPGIAKSILKLREALSLTQEDLAQLLGVAVRTVSRWEQGESAPQPLALKEVYRWQRLIDRLCETFRPDALPTWFHHPNEVLGGKTPWAIARSEDGAEQLAELINQIEWGIPA